MIYLDLQGLIGTPLGFCLFGRSQKFDMDAMWVIVQKSSIRNHKDVCRLTAASPGQITGNLVKSKLRVAEQHVHILPMNTQVTVDGVTVILLDANQ